MRLGQILTHEGFRLFFPLSAIYAGGFPALWLIAVGFDLTVARAVPPGLWHAHEMIVGALGAALLGFITTAVPEWTDTPAPRGRTLGSLCALWGAGRLISVFGWQGFGIIGALCDVLWIAALVFWLGRIMILLRNDRLVAFVFWLIVLAGMVLLGRLAFVFGDVDRALLGIHLSGFAFLGLLGVSLARITVPVTNLVLDPSERSSPFRPHPGRLNLAPGLVFVAITGQLLPLSPAVTGFLLIAAGAAFMDRVAEGFIGRAALRAEILMLAGASALAGIGLMLAGAARLGAPWGEVVGLHVAFMGGLGLGIYAVFSIAGLIHTDRPLMLTRATRVGALLLVGSVLLRIAPDLGLALPGPTHGVASLVWAAGFAVWICVYWPFVSAPPPQTTPANPSADEAPE